MAEVFTVPGDLDLYGVPAPVMRPSFSSSIDTRLQQDGFGLRLLWGSGRTQLPLPLSIAAEGGTIDLRTLATAIASQTGGYLPRAADILNIL